MLLACANPPPPPTKLLWGDVGTVTSFSECDEGELTFIDSISYSLNFKSLQCVELEVNETRKALYMWRMYANCWWKFGVFKLKAHTHSMLTNSF